eukprot:536107_1
MATLENANIFKDRTNCTQDDVLRCPSVVRMEAILKCFNTIAIDSSKESKKVSVLTVQSIQDIFSKNQYEYTHLSPWRKQTKLLIPWVYYILYDLVEFI